MGYFKEQEIERNGGLLSASYIIGEMLTRLIQPIESDQISQDELALQLSFPLPLADPVLGLPDIRRFRNHNQNQLYRYCDQVHP